MISVEEFLERSRVETIELIKALCRIPAPSGQELARAKFCEKWLIDQGAKGVYIDDALNVVYPVGCDGQSDIVVFSAHTDTVFPDTEPMPLVDDGEYLHSPGVGDDTTCLAVLLMVAKYVTVNNLRPKRGILFVANSCEEGLGNLKGIKQIMRDYAGKVTQAYTFDGQYDAVVMKCVGSRRYKITMKTEGGHSFRDFGNRNAIVASAKLISSLSNCDIPQKGLGNTTFNVGTIQGGTSVNTIAQETTFTYEYRSDDERDLQAMQEFFESEIQKAKRENYADILVDVIGERPCAKNVDDTLLEKIVNRVVEISQKHSGIPCKKTSGSTDCNIPMSLGIPAVCVGGYIGAGEHTREEKVEIATIQTGLKIAMELILDYFHE